MVELWAESSNVYLQSVHACYALGTFIAPLISEPFVSKNSTSCHNSTAFPLNEGAECESRIYIPYSISTVMLAIGVILHFAVYLWKPYRPLIRKVRKTETHSAEPAEELNHNEATNLILPNMTDAQAKESSYKYKIVIALICLFIFCEQCAEQTSGSYIQTFVEKYGIEKSKSEFLAATYSGSFTAMRAFSILLATRLKAATMIYLDLAFGLAGCATIYLSTLFNLSGLWVGFALLGSGFSSIFPSTFGYLETRINITNFISGLFFVTSSLGPIFTPLLIGGTVKAFPLVFVFVNSLSLLACLVLFFFIDRIKL